MRIEDRFSIAAPRHRVWQAIRSPEIVASCLPGCRDVEVISRTSYKAKIRVQLGPIKADFSIDIDVISEIEFEEVRSRSRLALRERFARCAGRVGPVGFVRELRSPLGHDKGTSVLFGPRVRRGL